jgi:hypothetical protein
MINAYGIMMTKDEADIIEEVLEVYKTSNIQIVAMDDSDDGTYDILKSFSNVTVFRQEDEYGRNTKGSGDWMFQAILDRKRKLFGINNFVFLAMGDEIYYHDPVKILYDMEIEEATVCIVHSCQFFMHISDKQKWNFNKQEWKNKDLKTSERLLWYSPGYAEERRIFWDAGNCYYDKNQHYRPLPLGIYERHYSKKPIIKHYPNRAPKQVLARAKDRVEREYQPFYFHSYNKTEQEVFFESFPGFNQAFKFEGDFREYEKGLEYLK